jgi:hypothetical protein
MDSLTNGPSSSNMWVCVCSTVGEFSLRYLSRWKDARVLRCVYGLTNQFVSIVITIINKIDKGGRMEWMEAGS